MKRHYFFVAHPLAGIDFFLLATLLTFVKCM